MYNRYIPQPDGTYRKRRVADPPQREREPIPEYKPPKQEVQDCPPEPKPVPPPCPKPATQPHNQQHTDAGDFLKRLLPKDLDTGDLLIILLLLLMAGDCKEEKNTALLTLALYFFL